MATFNVSGNIFESGSNMIENYNEYNFNWSQLEREIDVLKEKTEADVALSPAVTSLQSAIKCKDEGSIKQTISKYAADFLSSTFANLASSGIISLVKIFCPR